MPQISAKDAQAFGKVWTHKGVAIFLSDIHYQFAADFANVVLKSFIENAQRQAAQRAAEAAKPKIIMEGVS